MAASQMVLCLFFLGGGTFGRLADYSDLRSDANGPALVGCHWRKPGSAPVYLNRERPHLVEAPLKTSQKRASGRHSHNRLP